MRKLIMKMSISLDGFVSDTNGKNDWIFKTGDEESAAWSVGAIRQAGLIIMGRKSFETMAPYWPPGETDCSHRRRGFYAEPHRHRPDR
jgi:dihydrofolate reductase